MNVDILTLLCDPDTHEPLESHANALVNPRSGARYPLRDGIPDFAAAVSGENKKYQKMYDRIAWLYDVGERLYFLVRREKDRRREYLNRLEILSNTLVLEVSIGTGANLRYLPADATYYGLDLSWGMLRKCRCNLQKWKRSAELFHGEAERLPFRDAAFDVVFHVGGINFFNDKRAAIREMVRVAQPGSKLLIVDETEKVVTQQYKKTPVVRKYFQGEAGSITELTPLRPAEVKEVNCNIILDGKAYCLTFRKS